MENGNYSYFEIDPTDIWEYERSEYIEGNSSEEHIGKIYSYLLNIVVVKGKPSFKYSDHPEDYSFRNYYINKWKSYQQFDLYQKVLNSYFFFSSDCYEFNQNILLEPENGEFDYLFHLKLKQYKDKLSKVFDFLHFHLEKNFSNDEGKFNSFLKAIVRQYSNQLPALVTDTVNEYALFLVTKKLKTEPNPTENVPEISNPLPKQEPKYTRKSISPKSQNSKHSFALKFWLDNKDYFTENPLKVQEVLKQLKINGFLAENTTFQQFKALFTNSILIRENKITWTGTNKELSEFIKILIFNLQLVEDPKNDKYLIAIKAFVDKNLKPFEISQLRNASRGKKSRVKLLIEILKKMLPIDKEDMPNGSSIE